LRASAHLIVFVLKAHGGLFSAVRFFCFDLDLNWLDLIFIFKTLFVGPTRHWQGIVLNRYRHVKDLNRQRYGIAPN